MDSFNAFIKSKKILLEAKLSRGRVEKAFSLIKKLIEKRFGKIYPYGGGNGIVEYGKGIGALFILRDKRAIRINYESGELNSISIWKKFKLGAKADFTVEIGELNMIQVMDKILDIIQSPAAGNYSITLKEENEGIINESFLENYFFEARRVNDPTEYFQIIKSLLDPNENPASLKFNRIKELSLKADVNIPAWVRNNKSARGLFSIVPNENHTTKNSNTPPKDKDYYIKVTAQDSKTKSFISIKDDKYAKDLTSKIANFLEKPSNEEIKQQVRDPNTLFHRMTQLIQLVAGGYRNSLVIYGGPGIGKTFIVLNTLKELGKVKNKDWYLVKGRITTTSLYQTLFIHRQKNKILVFDDTDSVWADKDAANILKAALDSYESRTVSWSTARTKNVSLYTDEEKAEYEKTIDDKLKDSENDSSIIFPNEFSYQGQIIFISNLKGSDFDSAVLNRSAKIDMTLTQEEIFARIRSIADKIGGSDVPIEEKYKVLDYLEKRNSKMKDPVSMRTFVAALDLYRSGIPDWRDLLDYV